MQAVLVAQGEGVDDRLVAHVSVEDLAAKLVAAALDAEFDDHARRIRQGLGDRLAESLHVGVEHERDVDARLRVRFDEADAVVLVQREQVVVEDERFEIRVPVP